jgi:cyclophilin family peptidyl-prolyl cis-trans isomerase
MWERSLGRRSRTARPMNGQSVRPVRRILSPSRLDTLEDRQLMTASLQTIAPVTVPALQGYTVPLVANTGATDAQTFTVTSSNPDIAATVAQGPFWTLGVSYNDATDTADSFTGSLTFQLFQDFTPNTVKMIEQFTNDGFYTSTGDFFPRIVSGFDSPLTTVIQGGATSVTGAGSSGQPNTPFANENVQQLALTGVDQLALANAGGTDTNDTQFFINTGSADALGYNYTVFGQLVAGGATLAQIASIPVQSNPVTGEDSEPVNPLTISSASL